MDNGPWPPMTKECEGSYEGSPLQLITQLRQDLRDAVEIIKCHSAGSYYSVEEMDLIGCVECGSLFPSGTIKKWDEQEHKPDCSVRLAREWLNRPSVKAVMEEKP